MAMGFAIKNAYSVDPNKELLALGFASMASGLDPAFPGSVQLLTQRSKRPGRQTH